jgi:hypothetical protein
MPRYTRRRDDVQAIHVNWMNWPQIQAFLAEQNVVVQEYMVSETEISDSCGETGPYLAFVVQLPSGKEIQVRHGDWIIRGKRVREFLPVPPWLFDVLFEEYIPPTP